MRDRLEWQLRWHHRHADRAEYWIHWADLPLESLGHWRFIRKYHQLEAEKVAQQLAMM